MLRCSSNLSAKTHDIKPSLKRAALNSQPGEWSGSLLDSLGSWKQKPDEPGKTEQAAKTKKKGSGGKPWDRAADVGWMVEIHWGKMGPEPSHKTDYLDLVGAYLVSNMTTFSTAAK